MANTTSRLTESVAVIESLLPSAGAVQAMSDEAVLTTSQTIALARRDLEARAGWVAAEIARRSRRELGYGGLAQRHGFRSPEALVQNVTGSTRADAVTMVRVGTMVADTAANDTAAAAGGTAAGDTACGTGGVTMDPHWWRADVARAVTAGALSYAQAEAIRAGLGEATDAITGEMLADAVSVLLAAATNLDLPLTVDELRHLARQLRDSVDADGLLGQEKAQQNAQYVKAWRRNDGMVAGSLLLDRENGAYLLSILDGLTSPRRGGPRFVNSSDKRRAAQLIDDPRTTDRIAADGVMELLRIGVDADPNTVHSTRTPAVRIVVTRDTLIRAPGSDNRGVIEDTGESIGLPTMERHLCEGSTTVTVDTHGRPLDVGRSKRLFTARQKIALAIRDGGCMINGCDRPPSWTEAHHIDHWAKHHGKTDTADGILLCRHHHLMLHNNNWRILRDGYNYYLRKTSADDPDQTLIELRSKNPLTRTRTAQHTARQHSTQKHSTQQSGPPQEAARLAEETNTAGAERPRHTAKAERPAHTARAELPDHTAESDLPDHTGSTMTTGMSRCVFVW